jgi:hypothetical protein
MIRVLYMSVIIGYEFRDVPLSSNRVNVSNHSVTEVVVPR